MHALRRRPASALPSAPRGLICGTGDDGATWYASWDCDAHHVEPGPRCSKFAAALAPYRSRHDAELGLAAIGATGIESAR